MFPLCKQHGNTTCIKAVCAHVPPSSAVYSAHLSYVHRQRHMHTQIGQDHCFLMCEVPKWASPPGATAASVLVQGEMSITLPSSTSRSLRMAKEEWKGGLEGRWREVKVTESLPNRWGRRRDEEPNSRSGERSKGYSEWWSAGKSCNQVTVTSAFCIRGSNNVNHTEITSDISINEAVSNISSGKISRNSVGPLANQRHEYLNVLNTSLCRAFTAGFFSSHLAGQRRFLQPPKYLATLQGVLISYRKWWDLLQYNIFHTFFLTHWPSSLHGHAENQYAVKCTGNTCWVMALLQFGGIVKQERTLRKRDELA